MFWNIVALSIILSVLIITLCALYKSDTTEIDIRIALHSFKINIKRDNSVYHPYYGIQYLHAMFH